MKEHYDFSKGVRGAVIKDKESVSVSSLPVFDIVEHLDNDEFISEYLIQVIKDGDTNELMRAFCHVARAKGMTEALRHELDYA